MKAGLEEPVEGEYFDGTFMEASSEGERGQ